jgi:FkbM family methyltransferase
VTLSEWLFGKYYALRALTTMAGWFDNWTEVFDNYRTGRDLPQLRFRRGFILYHRPEDQALLQFYEVFRDKSYRRYSAESEYGTVIDIGANIGMVSLEYLTRVREVCVHAYEPHPATFQMLCRNLEVNHLGSRVSSFQEAVGGYAGTTLLHAGGLSMATTAYRFRSPSALHEQFHVPMVSLDTVIERCRGGAPIILAKIDAEGAEADILEGAHPAVLRLVKRFVIEYHESLCANAKARCIATLAAAGFATSVRPTANKQGLIYAWQGRMARSGICTNSKRLTEDEFGRSS